jgi:triacylglycerol esterase/lipase EstA (alpha/beta hydrolase family)
MRGTKLAISLAVTALAVPASAAAEELTVPWTAEAGMIAQGQAPNSAPAGSNDWDCESAEHPQPVVLVHGLAANRTVNWSTMSPFLANRGFCVFALTYGNRAKVDTPAYQPGGLKRMQDSAERLGRFVDKVREATGARKVDIVGHSEGSLMPNYWVKFMGGERYVDDYVGVTPLWDGTDPAGLGSLDQIGQALGFSDFTYETLEPFCASCRQFLTHSKFIAKMNSGGGPAVPGIDYTMILTRNDELVNPYTSGIMEGADNFVVQDQCETDQSEHLSIIFDPVTAYDILNGLSNGPDAEVPCTVVLPFVGAPAYTGN